MRWVVIAALVVAGCASEGSEVGGDGGTLDRGAQMCTVFCSGDGIARCNGAAPCDQYRAVLRGEESTPGALCTCTGGPEWICSTSEENVGTTSSFVVCVP